MVTRNDSLWKSLDWVTICIYLLLIVGGWFSVCGASYDYGDRDFLDFSTRAGKQFVWIICSFGLGFVLLMLEDRMYDMFAYIIYIGMIILLIVTIFYRAGYQRFPFLVGNGACQPAASRVCQVCYRIGIGQIYKLLFIQHKRKRNVLWYWVLLSSFRCC